MRFVTKQSSAEQELRSNIPVGFYKARIVYAKEGYVKDYPVMSLTFMVQTQTKEEKFECNVFLSDKSLWRMEQLLYALGLDFNAGQQISLQDTWFVGKTCEMFMIKRRSDMGKLYPEVRRFMRAGASPFLGEMKPESYNEYGLDTDGCKADDNFQTANNTVKTYNVSTNRGAYGMPHEQEDDIPF